MVFNRTSRCAICCFIGEFVFTYCWWAGRFCTIVLWVRGFRPPDRLARRFVPQTRSNFVEAKISPGQLSRKGCGNFRKRTRDQGLQRQGIPANQRHTQQYPVWISLDSNRGEGTRIQFRFKLGTFFWHLFETGFKYPPPPCLNPDQIQLGTFFWHLLETGFKYAPCLNLDHTQGEKTVGLQCTISWGWKNIRFKYPPSPCLNLHTCIYRHTLWLLH